MKRVVFILSLAAVIILLGKNLNPFDSSMFDFHDETQPARIQQFALNLKSYKIPPRLAPDFSFKLGYPVFNFYAPFSYWIGGILNLAGLDVVASLKISFILALTIAFIAAFLLLNQFFDFYPALIGGVSYVTSLYFAIDIFIRGNLAETWFLALFPLSLFFIYKNSRMDSRVIFALTVVITTAAFTAHNLLSLIYIPIAFLFILVLGNKVKNAYSFLLSLLLGAYFFLPMFLENFLTYTKEVAKLTSYKDHFLCPLQLWQSNWGYGGSSAGCELDGMPFKIGKPQLIFLLFGIIVFFLQVLKKKASSKETVKMAVFFLSLTIVSLFLTTYQSMPVWEVFAPLSSIVQFPWRFISFALIGIAFFTGYFFENIKLPLKNTVVIAVSFLIFIVNLKYFYKPVLTISKFNEKYISQEYIEKGVAYKVAEYLPKVVDYDSWRKQNLSFSDPVEADKPETIEITKNTPFEKQVVVSLPQQIKVNIHYFPFWNIFVDNQPVIPTVFDNLGRPVIKLSDKSTVKIRYNETLIEKAGNGLSIVTLLILSFLFVYKPLWTKHKI
jgi:hypothetical protein